MQKARFFKKKKKGKNFYFIPSRSDRSVQLNGHRLRKCRDENYFKWKGNEISTDHEPTFVQSLTDISTMLVHHSYACPQRNAELVCIG